MTDSRKTATRFEVKNADTGEVDVVFSTLNVVDSDGDVTLPGAFHDGAPLRVSAYGHTSWDGMLPIGRGKLRATDTEGIAETKFFMDVPSARDTFSVVKGMGDLQEWSYGYDVLESAPGQFAGQQVRFLKDMDVHEVSPVLLGAGVGTRTLSAKSHQHESPPETVSSHLSRAHGVPLEAQPSGAQSRHALHIVMHGGDIADPAKLSHEHDDTKRTTVASHLKEMSDMVADLSERLARAAAVRADRSESFSAESVEKAAALAGELDELKSKLLLVTPEPDIRLRAEALDTELAMMEKQYGLV